MTQAQGKAVKGITIILVPARGPREQAEAFEESAAGAAYDDEADVGGCDRHESQEFWRRLGIGDQQLSATLHRRGVDLLR